MHRQGEEIKFDQVKKEEEKMEKRDLERIKFEDNKMKNINVEKFKSGHSHNENEQYPDIVLKKEPSFSKDKTSTSFYTNKIQEITNKSPSIEILKDRNNKVSSMSYSEIQDKRTEEDLKDEKKDKSIKENCEDEVKSFVEETKKDEKLTNDSLSLLNRVNKILDIAKSWEITKNSVNDNEDESKAGNNQLNDSSDESDDESRSRNIKENYKTKQNGSRNKNENSISTPFTRSLEDGEIQHSDTEATTDDIDDIILDDSDAIKPTNRKVKS